jgi:hypothetical protein
MCKKSAKPDKICMTHLINQIDKQFSYIGRPLEAHYFSADSTVTFARGHLILNDKLSVQGAAGDFNAGH